MAISDEIARLQQAKADLKTAIEGKGVTVPSNATLDDYPALVDSIEAGGGSGENMIKFIKIDLSGKSTSRSNPYIIDITDDDVIYNVYEIYDHSQYFRFNIKGKDYLSEVLSISEDNVFFARIGGSSTIRKYTLSGYI